jgi:hypothetical protein
MRINEFRLWPEAAPPATDRSRKLPRDELPPSSPVGTGEDDPIRTKAEAPSCKIQSRKPLTMVTYSIALWGASRESRPDPRKIFGLQKGSVIDPAIHQARSARIEELLATLTQPLAPMSPARASHRGDPA